MECGKYIVLHNKFIIFYIYHLIFIVTRDIFLYLSQKKELSMYDDSWSYYTLLFYYLLLIRFICCSEFSV